MSIAFLNFKFNKFSGISCFVVLNTVVSIESAFIASNSASIVDGLLWIIKVRHQRMQSPSAESVTGPESVNDASRWWISGRLKIFSGSRQTASSVGSPGANQKNVVVSVAIIISCEFLEFVNGRLLVGSTENLCVVSAENGDISKLDEKKIFVALLLELQRNFNFLCFRSRFVELPDFFHHFRCFRHRTRLEVDPKVLSQVTLVEMIELHVRKVLVGVDDCATPRALVQQHCRQRNVAVWIIKRVVAADAAVFQIFNHENEHFVVGKRGQKFAFPAKNGQDSCIV